MPGHVRTRVKAMRRERLERDPVAAPPAEVTDEPGKYREALKGEIQRIADGPQRPEGHRRAAQRDPAARR